MLIIIVHEYKDIIGDNVFDQCSIYCMHGEAGGSFSPEGLSFHPP